MPPMPRSESEPRVTTRALITVAQLINNYCKSTAEWRDRMTITKAKYLCDLAQGCAPPLAKGAPIQHKPGFTVGVFSSGGCLDTLAAIRSGFTPVWGTEICERKRSMWRDLTRTRDLGSTWDVNWNEQVVPDMIISGTPCIDFSSSGACMGEYGNTGWMFSAQAEPILLLSPNSFCIEMVANCLKVNGGRAFKSLVDQLETQYIIKHEVIRTMEHGDSSNRTRVFIVGLHKRLGDAAHSFVFPTGDAPPTPARSQAVPDHSGTRELLAIL